MTGAELAVAIVKAEKATGKRRITDTAEDADCLNGITEDAGTFTVSIFRAKSIRSA